ncbi:MAG: C25 family cysteine peptidase [Bacteroidetes bacterium]|nr:C25 family cysteine peptidase [Bacteroidota bacterium]
MLSKQLIRLILVLGFVQLSSVLLAGSINIKSGNNAVNFTSVPFQSLNVTVDVSTLDFRDVQTRLGPFTELFAESFGFNNNAGEPKLPVYHKLIQVPVDAGYDIEITYSHFQEFRLIDYGIGSAIIPAQAPLSKNITDPDQIPFVMNQVVYQQNKFTDAPLLNVTYEGIMRSVVLARLDISPVQYNPVTGMLRVYDRIEARVVFTHPDLQATKRLLDKYTSPYYQAFYSRIPNYTKSADSLITSSPATYLIVSHSSFKETLKPFIAWKTRKGFKVIAGYTDNAAVGTTNASIKAYIQGIYNNPPSGYNPPSFVLFVGDVGQIPAWNTGGHPSDMYYCEFTNDHIPEITYGRFAAQNATQLNAYIDKTLEYEQYTMPTDDFLGEVVMVAGADATNGPIYGNGQINYGTNNYFNTAHNLLSHTYLQPEPGGANYATNIRQNVSNGVGFANYTAHGSESGWADPSFQISHIPALQNAHKYPLMIGNCCKAANYSTTCFSKEITRVANKGALGYIGCSDYSYWDEDYWWACGYKTVIAAGPPYDPAHLGAYDKTFHDNGEPLSEYFVTMGQMVQGGNLAVQESSSGMKVYYWETYCLMGDPSLCIYYSVPPALQATFEHTRLLTMTTLSVTTEPYSYVALSLNDSTLLDARFVDATGIAVLNFPAVPNPGYARMIITRQNRKPVIDSVYFIPAEGPYIELDNYTISDSVGGNNNHLGDYNENISLNVTLKNLGVAASGNVSGTLTSNDTNVVITHSTFNFGVVPAGGNVTGNTAFGLFIRDNVTDQHKAICSLLLTDGSHSWTQELDIILNAPSLNVTLIQVIDPAPGGNNNGMLDPGETATLKITMMNSGHASAVNCTAHLFPDPQSAMYILVTNPNIYLGYLPEMAPTLAYFNVSVNGITPLGTDVFLNFTGTAGLNNQYFVNKQCTVEVGEIPVVKMHIGTETTCSSWFLDSGGIDFNYSNSENMTLTFYPGTTGASMKVKFHLFDVESSTNCINDYLRVYNGISTTAPLMGTYCGNTLPDSLVSTDATGALTFLWRSNPTVTKPGWKALMSCVGGTMSIQYNAFPSIVCLGGSSQLAVIPSGGTGVYTYQWVPSTYLDDPGSQFPVSVPQADISYIVTVSDGTSQLTSSPIPVTLAPVPAAPVITLNGSQLESNLGTGNQWYLNGNAIPGATGQTYQLSAYGNYTDIYTDPVSFCTSVPSNTIMYYPVGTGDQVSGRSIAVYPNPFSEMFTIVVDAGKQDLVRVSMYDTYGNRVLLMNQQGSPQAGRQMITVDASRLNPGMYFCRIQTDNWTEIRKVILSK